MRCDLLQTSEIRFPLCRVFPVCPIKKSESLWGIRKTETVKTAQPMHPCQKQTMSALRKKHKHILCSVLQSPGLKSDILHENSRTHRPQPFASSHIFWSPVLFRWSVQSRKIYYNIKGRIFQGFRQNFLLWPIENFYEYHRIVLCILHNRPPDPPWHPLFKWYYKNTLDFTLQTLYNL